MRACLLASVAVLAGVTLGADQPTFRAGVDLVTFGVTAIDKKGNLVTDLTQDDFEIFEDGKPQAIKYFARGDATDSAPELHVGLLFDTSGSMGEDINLARSAAIKFLNTLSDARDITLVDFDTQVRITRYRSAISRGSSSASGSASRKAGPRCTTRSARISTAPISKTAGRCW